MPGLVYTPGRGEPRVTNLVGTARSAVWGPLSSKVRASRVREPAIRTYRAVARAVLTGPPPKLFANSIPKAGTHLLTQLLGEAPKMWYCGDHVVDRPYYRDAPDVGDDDVPVDPDDFDSDALAARLARVRNGQFVTAHMAGFPAVREVVAEHGFASVLMIRDPRDIAVSMANYFASNARLHTYRRFHDELPTLDARLHAVITGLPAVAGSPRVPSMGERLGKYVGWLGDHRTLVVRFEDLVGSAGGGSDHAQLAATTAVLRAADRYESEQQVSAVARAVFAPHAATFRRGAIGEWREHFTPEHETALETSAPGGVAALGYA